jgi:hypothetical protein
MAAQEQTRCLYRHGCGIPFDIEIGSVIRVSQLIQVLRGIEPAICRSRSTQRPISYSRLPRASAECSVRSLPGGTNFPASRRNAALQFLWTGFTIRPEAETGRVGELAGRDVPVDGFWSVTVYVVARLYGPQMSLFDKTWVMPDFEKAPAR